MGTRGIQKFKVKEEAAIKNRRGIGKIIELGEELSEVTVFVDEDCLGINTKNPITTLNDVKWLIISEFHFIKVIQNTIDQKNFLQTLKNNIEDKHYRILSGNNIIINNNHLLRENRNGYLGIRQLLIPFTIYPERKLAKNIVALDKPQVQFCSFLINESDDKSLNKKLNKIVYGKVLKIRIRTHLLPDFRNNEDNFEAKLNLVKKDNNKIMGTVPIKITAMDASYNLREEFEIALDPKWSEEHVNKKDYDSFYLTISDGEITFNQEMFSEQGKNNPLKDIEFSSDKKTAWLVPESEKNIYQYTNEIFVFDDKLSDILYRFENTKNNQIALIGDVNYSYKEYDPCGYSKISIYEEGKEDDALIIFNEGGEEEGEKIKKDDTHKSFDIISGDDEKQAKTIIVKVEGLETTNDSCQSVLLNEGEKHTNKDNIFITDKIWSAIEWEHKKIEPPRNEVAKSSTDVAKKNSKYPSEELSEIDEPESNYEGVVRDRAFRKGTYKKNEDTSHKGETGQFGADYDLEKVDDVDGFEVQELLETDYEKDLELSEGIATFTFKNLRYTYNKSGLLWQFNYFKLSEDKAQTYFVPVSTCRYSNQIAQVKVYPDIEWEFNLLFNTTEPVWYGLSEPTYNMYKVKEKVTRDNIDFKDVRTLKDIQALGELRKYL